jgi:hypothetical protein
MFRSDARAERVSRVLLVWRGQRRLRAVSIDGATSDVPVSASCRSPHWKALASAATKGRRWRAPSSGLKLMSAAVVGYSGFPLQFLGVLQDL